jgi:hypothetical protein
MIIDNKLCDFIQCYDCLFSMNYNDKKILNGSMGIHVKDYIDKSIKYHALINELPCSRLNDNGGCYICMKLLDIPFDDEFVNTYLNQNLNLNLNKNLNLNNCKTPVNTNTDKESGPYVSHNISFFDNINTNDDFILSL